MFAPSINRANKLWYIIFTLELYYEFNAGSGEVERSDDTIKWIWYSWRLAVFNHAWVIYPSTTHVQLHKNWISV